MYKPGNKQLFKSIKITKDVYKHLNQKAFKSNPFKYKEEIANNLDENKEYFKEIDGNQMVINLIKATKLSHGDAKEIIDGLPWEISPVTIIQKDI